MLAEVYNNRAVDDGGGSGAVKDRLRRSNMPTSLILGKIPSLSSLEVNLALDPPYRNTFANINNYNIVLELGLSLPPKSSG